MKRPRPLIALRAFGPGEADGSAILAAAVLRDALRLARRGDTTERAWLTDPQRVGPWAGMLGLDGERLARIARRALED